MRRRLLAAVLLLAPAVPLAAAAPAPGAVQLAQVGTFERPTYVTAPPGDHRRVMVVEQTGRVRLLLDGARQPGAFLDVSALSTVVSPNPVQYTERGFFSIAFAPDYATSGRLYAFYTAQANGALRVDEFRRGADPDHIDSATRRPVLEIAHDQRGNHNGGQLQFGPDGMLYAGTGDGGGGGDPADNGQNLTRTSPAVVAGVNQSPLLGKILRIDPRGGTPYAVPADNPFPAPAREVFALGLRNPYRFSFDRATGDLVIADVGQNAYEEIDLAPAATGRGRGTNFGWRLYEGLHTSGGAPVGSPRPAGYAFPVIEHPHSGGWCSITGGYVVRDPALPDLAGQYVYGDYCLGRVWAARLAPGAATGVRQLDLPAVGAISSFGEDACGRVYVTSLNGPVYRLSDGGACAVDGAPDVGRVPPAGGPPVIAGQPDRRAPSLSVTAAARQRALRTGFVTVRVGCDERCAVRVTGRVLLARVRTRSRRPSRARAAAAGPARSPAGARAGAAGPARSPAGARAGAAGPARAPARARARAAAAKPLLVRTRRATLAAGARARLRVLIARSTRARIGRALRRPRRSATVSLTVRAADAAGNVRTRRARVRIVRR